MLVYAQNDYSSNWDNWDSKNCPSLKNATFAWLIINYVMLGCTGIYSIFFIFIGFCDCDYNFSEYDLKY